MAILLALMLAFGSVAYAEETTPQMPEGMTPPDMTEGGTPPDMPEGGTPPDMPEGGTPPERPDGQRPEGGMPGGGMGGGANKPDSYLTVTEVNEDSTLEGGSYASTGTDENVFHVRANTFNLSDAVIDRTSADSTGGDTASFYGVGAAILTTGGTANVTGSTITTDAAGAAGVFAYGEGVANVSDSNIHTVKDTSGGIHVAGGGTLHAKNLTVVTEGESSAAIRSDRGSGTMRVDGGSYTAHGVGSPAVYVTADIAINGSELVATGSEALCLEGLNSIRLYDSSLSGNMKDLSQNDNTWTVILYQSMSGDSEIGEGRFEMVGGSITSENGGLFYTTNTESEFVLSGVTIQAAEDSEYFLRCTGNTNQRGWGTTGANGAQSKFTAIAQQMDGDVIWDTISQLDMYVTEGSQLTGAVRSEDAGEGEGYCTLNVDASSTWIVTGNSQLSALNCEGTILDAGGNQVSVVGTDGTVFVEGTSEYTVTVRDYRATCDLVSAGTAGSWASTL